MGKGVILPSVTQPIAHSPLVVLTNLSRWPVTGLERIQTNPIPTATRYSRQVRGCATGSPFHTPFSGTKQQWGQKIVVLLVPWVGRSFMSPQMGTATQGPGDAWEPSAALACRELGSGTHRRHPPLQPLPQLPAGTTAELPLPSFQPLHQKEKKKKKWKKQLEQLPVVNTSATICHSPLQHSGPLLECCVLLDIYSTVGHRGKAGPRPPCEAEGGNTSWGPKCLREGNRALRN